MASLESDNFPPLRLAGGVEPGFLEAAGRLLTDCLVNAGAAPANIPVSGWGPVRSDFLSVADAEVIPQELRERGLVPRDCETYCGSLYETQPKIVVLSLLADVVQPALRHRREHYRFVPLSQWQSNWNAAQRAWVAEQFIEEPVLGHEEAARHWRALLPRVQQAAGAGVFLCNLFRYTPGKPAFRHYGMAESIGERIRRFNRLAVELSQETGIYIVDLDRACSHHGARELQTDYRLGGSEAARIVTEMIVWTILRAGLDDFLTPELQAEALNSLQAAIAFGHFQRQLKQDAGALT